MEKFANLVERINGHIGGFLWGPPMLALFLLCGLYFSVKTGFFQITGFGFWFKNTLGSLFKKKEGGQGSITQWQAFSTALAGTLGTGNIIGVATAISLGGAGAVFWMLVSAVLGMMTAFAERTFGIIYRERDKNGDFAGGPMHYIEKGLGSRPLALIYAALCVGASFGMGCAAQSNAAAVALRQSFNVPPLITGIATAAAAGIILLGGIKRVGRVNEILMPAISLFYIAGCLAIMIINRQNLSFAVKSIFAGAFSFKSAGAGTGGFVISRAIKYGIARGVFSNEAGLGASVIAHSTAQVKHPAEQGMWGICEVFLDTVVICTLTALAVLSTPGILRCKDGEILTLTAFNQALGSFGEGFLSVSITLFAVASVVGWSFYGERAYKYICGGSAGYRAVFLAVTVLGAVMSLKLVWELSDTLNGLMAVPNLIAVFILFKRHPVTKSDILRIET
ncbi:MAG: sodium:alanine symporter family protein [Clostridia bacterium]|nr:sodium:alanine symporter family protein [Clostridia bacterium]